MSAEDGKPKDKEPQDGDAEDGRPKKLEVRVSRSAEVEGLTADLTKERLAKEKAEREKKETEDRLTAEKKVVEDKLKEKEGILQQQALEEFEKKRKQIIDLCKDSKLTEDQIADIEEKLEDPANIDTVEGLVAMLASIAKAKDKEPEPAPSGKAPMTPTDTPPKAGDAQTKVELIDQLYKVAYGPRSIYTKQEQEEAKTKIDTLWTSLIKGKSWKQLREGQALGKFKITSCPTCKATIFGVVPEKCPYCGFNFTKTGDRE